MDLAAFRAFEHEGWERLPEQYHQAFASLTTQSVEPLLDAARVEKGARVLDIASGPGYVAGAAAERGAIVTGVDFSSAMVAQAKRAFAGVDFREGDAESLVFADASFDAAVMNYGMLHLARPDKAIAEAYRVLRAGGWFAFTVWAPPERTAGFGIVLRAIERHGKAGVGVPEGPPFFRFGEAAEARRSLAAAGFSEPAVREVPQLWRLPSGEAYFQVMLHSTVRTGALLRAQPAAELEAIRAAVVAAAERYRTGDAVELPMPAVLSAARK